MYKLLQMQLQARVGELVKERYGVEVPGFAVELPPRIELGEMALTVALQLARPLKKPPRAIAEELQSAIATVPGVARIEIAGPGYLNVQLDRAAAVVRIAGDEHAPVGGPGFQLLEHTSINPNKAAHVGHLRNAILGDSLARMLRPGEGDQAHWKRGYDVAVQNYIDNTGVQVADIVVAITELKGMSLADVREWLTETLESNERIDYVCWDLYAQVSQWYDADPEQAVARKKIRLDTLHALEAGGNETARIAELIATSVLRAHLETMQRLDIEYDFLPRESEILRLHFWEAARKLMVERGVLSLETAGKNAGCWVMRRAGATALGEGEVDEDAKIIIRSNGTVTYVGKDIAYHLWKFGLLGLDFGYAKFHEYPDRTCWISTVEGERPHPSFGHASAVYNVIDSRQDDPQAQVKEALRALGYVSESEHFTHLNYAMVALTPRCAEELGYTLREEDKSRSYIEVSGRKGFGVKADDLIDRMIAAAREEVDKRHPELDETERASIANAIGVGALRFFMLRFTRNTVIAFDFRDALSFEGETGPYVQYAAVRAANIFRKAEVTEADALSAVAEANFAPLLNAEDDLWELWLTASRLTLILEQGIAAAEPATLTRYAFQLAQGFNNFYHRHNILKETDPTRRALLLATAAVSRRELVRVLGWLGIEVPSAM